MLLSYTSSTIRPTQTHAPIKSVRIQCVPGSFPSLSPEKSLGMRLLCDPEATVWPCWEIGCWNFVGSRSKKKELEWYSSSGLKLMSLTYVAKLYKNVSFCGLSSVSEMPTTLYLYADGEMQSDCCGETRMWSNSWVVQMVDREDMITYHIPPPLHSISYSLFYMS